jgi:ATP-dependent DNA ligase
MSSAKARLFTRKPARCMSRAIVSKRADAPYTPGNRGLWRKVKCLNRAEFVVVGWTEPEGRRPYLGALLLAYYDPDGRLIYAGRVGTGIDNAELERLWRRLATIVAIPNNNKLLRTRIAVPGDKRKLSGVRTCAT